MEKMTTCKVCGENVAKSAKTCPHCGAKLKRSKWWVWVIVALLFFGIIGSSGNKEDKDAEPEKAVTEASTETAETTAVKSASDPELRAALESALEKYGDNYSITETDGIIMIGVWGDGIIAEALIAKNGDADLLATWDEMVASLVSEQKQLQGVANAAGYNNVPIVLTLVNDMNHDSVLLTIASGTVMYDFVNDIDLISQVRG